MNLTENVINSIKEFLSNEETLNFFMIKGFKPILGNDNTVYLKNLEKKTMEMMEVKDDINNKERIRFKGKTWAFSVNHNNQGAFYLDHLLIGNVKKEEFDFIMRHRKTKDEDSIIVKLVDENKIKHVYIFKNTSVTIRRINKASTVKIGEQEKASNDELKAQINANTEDTVETFSFIKNEIGNCILLNKLNGEANKALREFLILERTYLTITGYIAKIIPFINDCIIESNNVRKQDNEVKEYTIKRKKSTTTNEDLADLSARANRKLFKSVPNDEKNKTKIYMNRKAPKPTTIKLIEDKYKK